MTEVDLDRIAARLAASADRVNRVETSVGAVVVKRQRPARGRWHAVSVSVSDPAPATT